MTDLDLFRAFESGVLSREAFSHRVHVQLGWIYVGRFPLAEAIERFSARLKSWARKHGADGLYHETITWAYLMIINERRHRQPEEEFEDFIAANKDLIGKPSVLEDYYTRETLESDYARHHYVMPDKAIALKAA
ncbi:hypothetical protein [Kordiimonas gwangyangensis]|uniref:hypothetical protein n=1 Tax=Kordiimonas gwangyangensis TaxID=288022 RepID=UPI000372AC98|nr:hypothetical protein [Kordiimonas gwangyangensis]